MKKFIILYLGPVGLDITPPAITKSALDNWAQQMSSAVVDRGSLFIPHGKSVVDNGAITEASFPLFGYSIVQAQDMLGATTLIRNHPFIANKGNKGNYEIEIIEFTDGDVPEWALNPPDEDMFTPASQGTSATPQIVPPQPNPGTVQPQNNSTGELNVPHDFNTGGFDNGNPNNSTS